MLIEEPSHFNSSPESKTSDVAYLVFATVFKNFVLGACFPFFSPIASAFQACRGFIVALYLY